MRKLAIITSHPIQYNAPLFRLLKKRNKIIIKVFYTWSQAINEVNDKNFGQTIKWDISLLGGYCYEIIENVSKKPGSHHRKGIINPKLITRVDFWKPDALLVFGWNFTSHFNVIRYYKGKIPVFFRGDSTLLDENNSFKTILRRIYLTRVYKYIDFALYVGKNNKEYFLKHGLKEKQLISAPHAIDNKRFMGDEGACCFENLAKEWRKQLGYTERDIVVLFAGKFEPKKDPFFLIKSIDKLAKISPYQKIKLLMVGNGKLEDNLKASCLKNENIKFLPFQNQSKMPILYRVADLFCLPSRGPNETWGLAVNEAMASMRPVLVSDKVGCAIDLVINGYNGYIFKHSDIESFVSKFLKMQKSKEKIKEMGYNAYSFIQSWSYEKICFAIESNICS